MQAILVLIKLFHFVVCIGLIVIVLLQADKGEGLAGAFGGGASGTVFGERGGNTFMTRLTTGMAIAFMLTSLFISVYLPKLEKKAPAVDLSSRAPIETSIPTPAGLPALPEGPSDAEAPTGS